MAKHASNSLTDASARRRPPPRKPSKRTTRRAGDDGGARRSAAMVYADKLAPALSADDRLVRKPYVAARIGVSIKTLDEMVAKGLFPPPYRITPRIAVWRKSQVDRFVEDGGRWLAPVN